MPIAKVATEQVSARYTVPFAITGGTSDVLSSILVRVTDADGRFGIGEVSPMTAYSGVPFDEVRRCIDHVLAPALDGTGETPGTAHLVMDASTVAAGVPGEVARLAVAGVDIALHDLWGRRLQAPVHELLGGAVRQRLDLCWVVGLRPVADTVAEAREAVASGHRTIKLKVGRDPQRDVAAIRAVRDALPEVTMRVDANAGYEPATAVEVLTRVREAELELVEQPVAGRDLEGLAHVRRSTGARILADESLQSISDAVALVRAGACDVFNLKITKPGGLHRARQVAGIAQAAGVGVMVGSMPELGVASAAGLHLALGLPHQPHACELLGPFMVDQDIVTTGGIQMCDGAVQLTDATAAGLGVEVDA